MARIVTLGGYGPGDSFGAIYRAFQRAGHDVVHVPSMPNRCESLPSGDILFTWNCGCVNIPHDLIPKANFKHRIFLSCDDPHWSSKRRVTDVCFQHDIILTCCLDSIDEYKRLGAKRVYFMPPAYDPLIYRPDLPIDPRYQSEVSFACTNLYTKKDWPTTIVDRAQFIEAMRQSTVRFKLWGPAYFKDLYGYSGHLTWMEIPHMHANTTMNVNMNGTPEKFTFNERFFSIAGIQKAQFIDRVPGYERLFEDGVNVIFFSSLQELIDKIEFYRYRTDLLTGIAAKATELLGDWTYDTFVRLVMEAIEGKDIEPPFMKKYGR